MTRVILNGCNGRMGRALTRLAAEADVIEIVAGIDIGGEAFQGYPVFDSAESCDVSADVVVDFSNASALTGILGYAVSKNLPVILATTGYSPEQLTEISRAAEVIPVFRSANMSIGVNLLLKLADICAGALADGYDIEIIERHHNQKVDAPSGTAIMLADAIAAELPYDSEYVYSRHDVRKKRDRSEIGIHSVRGGTIVGDHEVIFAGSNEIISLSHSATSREVFAVGAIRAAVYMAGKTKPGLYDMNSLLSGV